MHFAYKTISMINLFAAHFFFLPPFFFAFGSPSVPGSAGGLKPVMFLVNSW